MPTFEASARFLRDYDQLTQAEQEAFQRAVSRLVADLRRGRFRPGLRVKSVRGAPGIFEMTCAPNGRATFQYGAPIHEGEVHVIWRRIGTHDVFAEP